MPESNLDDLLEDYADEEGELKGEGDLKVIAELANQMQNLEGDIEKAEAVVRALKEQHREIEQERLPDAMQAVGMSDFTLSDGSKVTVTSMLQTSFKADLKPKAIEWLDEHGHGGIIKHLVSVGFGRGENDRAHEAIEMLSTAGFPVEDKEDVNFQTLQKWGRELAREGDRPPEELFNVFDLVKAKIKAPKK
jgi:hypothetical protein